MKPRAFDPFSGQWQRPFPACLSRHDIVYESPPEDALQGLPVGNGDMGLLLWTEGSRLVAALNKVDLFDDYPEPGGATNRIEYDREPALRHGARLVVDFGMPVFDILFLQRFLAKIRLADAAAEIESQTPFLGVKIRAFGSAGSKVIALECENRCGEEVTVSATLERFGSRPYPYWYSAVNRDAAIGTQGTQTQVCGSTVLITQQLRTLHFAAGMRIAGTEHTARRMSAHAGRFETGKAKRSRFTLYLSIVTSENASNPEAEVVRLLDAAERAGVAKLRARHAREWKRFWNASFLSIPDDYLENIWHLNLYYANSSCQGAYPPRFNNGIWGWNRDVSNWVYYFHWNMQNFIWPLHTANHAELAEPYFHFRRRSLDNAMTYAKNNQGRAGAFYADVADRLGNNVGAHWSNETPGAQIALLFWKHYRFTLDRRFLETQAWPVMREVARYYASLVVRGSDGVFRTLRSQAYEGSPVFEEVITDTAMIKALMPAAADCAALLGLEDGETARWREIGEHMNGFDTVELDSDETETDASGKTVFRHGLGKGCEVLAGRAFTVGKYVMLEGEDREGFRIENVPDFIREPLKGVQKGDRIRNRHGNPERPAYYGIPDPEFAPVYPAGLIGLRDRESELFKTCVDQARLHPPTVPQNNPGTDMTGAGSAMCMGWCPYPIVLARLGLAREAAEAVENSVKAWQFYCQGFGHYGPYEVFTRDKDNRWHTNTVTDVKTKEKLLSPAWPFRHFTLEAVPIACAALNEMLLQSYDGFLRLLPAAPPAWSGSFKLAAEGGFTVHAQFTGGRADWFAVESRTDTLCKAVSPWGEKNVYVHRPDAGAGQTDTRILKPVKDGPDLILEFPVRPGALTLLTPQRDALSRWRTQAAVCKVNGSAKRYGSAQLGLPRMY
ncbi:MAG TPA: hypothetical protein PLD68_00805 [Clostridiales bacterium]|nr:hypothetical protein [Clostridiales bacterium]